MPSSAAAATRARRTATGWQHHVPTSQGAAEGRELARRSSTESVQNEWALYEE
eukprot:COSAG06_NODE_40542_length_401_cov_0.622517_2_plen_52_part_01